MDSSINEMKSDLQELEDILAKVTRSNVRQIIAESISKLKSKLDQLEEKKIAENKMSVPVEERKEKTDNKLYNVKITTYGWDQSNKFVKLYVTVDGVGDIKEDQLSFECTESSFKLTISNHRARNHILQIMKLAHKIVPEESKPRLKSDSLVIMLRKKDDNTWDGLTESQRKDKEAKDSKYTEKPSSTDSSDPSSGIMDLMKKMYDEGDDDMKRMIKKTWYETQQKQNTGQMPSFE